MREIDEIYVHKFRSPELYVVDEQELEEDRAYLREYEGSPMFALYPDKVTMFGVAKNIYDKISYKEADETLLHMIEIMVCHEFYIRRCRYRKRRKYF